MAAVALSYLCSSFFGLPCSGEEGSAVYMVIYVVLLTVLMGFLALKGGSKSIKLAENISVIGIVVLTVWITIVVLQNFNMGDILAWRPAADEKVSFGAAFDSIAALAMAWVIAGADYSRYAKSKPVAAGAPMLGANLGMLWLSIVGAISAIALAITNGAYNADIADPASVCTGLGLGNIAQLLIILSVVAVNLLNIYSGGFCALNISSKISPKAAMSIIAGCAALLALVPLISGSFIYAFQIFLGYLGAVFPPCIAILVVDYFLIRKGNYEHGQLTKEQGKYWYKNGFNWKAVICWILGAASYFVLGKIPFISNTIGCVFGCLLISAVLYYIVCRIKRD